MPKNAVSVRIDESKIEELDELAVSNKRDRTFIINEAIDLYLEANRWQIARIKSAFSQAKKGEFASPAQVSRAIKQWRK